MALPLDDVDQSLHQLILIETVAGATLLAPLAGGSRLILRRGLHPPERMATTAHDPLATAPAVEPSDDLA